MRPLFVEVARWYIEIVEELAATPLPLGESAMTARRIVLEALFQRACLDRDIEPPAVGLSRSCKPLVTRMVFGLGRVSGESPPLPIETLGAVHERFVRATMLGGSPKRKHVLHHAFRDGSGVHYTPPFLARVVVERTLAPLVVGRDPRALLALRIVDPACGAGAFLLAAFDFLVQQHEAFYVALAPVAKSTTDVTWVDGSPRLTLRARRDIITRCLYGFDIDAEAIEVARRSLFLKLYEGAPHSRRGTTLKAFSKVRATDALALDLAGRFDAVVGNPPYLRARALRRSTPPALDVHRRTSIVAGHGNIDLYLLFIEHALSALKVSGRVGLVVPNKVLYARYAERLRVRLAQRRSVDEVIDFGDAQLFVGATAYVCVLILSATPLEWLRLRRVETRSGVEAGLLHALAKRPQRVRTRSLGRDAWSFADASILALSRGARPLGDLGRIFVGVQTSADDVFHVRDLTPAGRGLVSAFSVASGERVVLEQTWLRPIVSGRDVKRYAALTPATAVLFPYDVRAGRAELLREERLAAKFPQTHAYLKSHEERLRAREGGKHGGDGWYRFGRSQNLAVQGMPKLCVPSLVRQPEVTLDARGAVFLDNVDVCAFAPHDPSRAHALYLLALLNSAVLRRFFQATASRFRGGFYRCNKQTLERFPIRVLDRNLSGERAFHDALVALVERRLALGSDVGGELATTREEIDRAIDERVTKLYA